LSPFPNQIVYRRVSPSIGGTPSFVTLNFEFVLFLTLRDSSRLRVFVVDSVQALARRREDAKNRQAFGCGWAAAVSSVVKEGVGLRKGVS